MIEILVRNEKLKILTFKNKRYFNYLSLECNLAGQGIQWLGQLIGTFGRSSPICRLDRPKYHRSFQTYQYDHIPPASLQIHPFIFVLTNNKSILM